MKPLRSKEYGRHQLLNPEFRYVQSAATDVRATFERAREQMRREAEAQSAELKLKVRNIGGKRG